MFTKERFLIVQSGFNAEVIGNRLAKMRKEAGLTQKDIAQALGISLNAFSFYERGQRKPSADILYKLNKIYGFDLHYLLTGESQQPKTKEKQSNREDEFTLVPRYDIEVSAGAGSFVETENIVSMLSFRTSWLESLNLHKGNANIVTAKGDSMEPTIKNGSILLVKTDDTIDIEDGSIYVINYSDQTFVKRLKRDLKGIYILSDNKQYEDQFISYEELEQSPLNIAGRVVWYGSYV